MDMKMSGFEKNMVACAFAEAGDFKTAKEMLFVAGAKKEGPARGAKAVKAGLWGLASASLLALVFVNEDLVTDLYTRGKWFAALPIASVFIFTFVHASFAHNFLSTLGIEPKGKK